MVKIDAVPFSFLPWACWRSWRNTTRPSGRGGEKKIEMGGAALKTSLIHRRPYWTSRLGFYLVVISPLSKAASLGKVCVCVCVLVWGNAAGRGTCFESRRPLSDWHFFSSPLPSHTPPPFFHHQPPRLPKHAMLVLRFHRRGGKFISSAIRLAK